MIFDLKECIKDDYKIFDNIFKGKIIHVLKTAKPDFVSGSINNPVIEKEIEGCLFRDKSVRNASSIKQTTSRDASLQNDIFYKSDLVVEIPFIADLAIDEGDKFVDTRDSVVYNIVSVDYVTLTTRFRCAITRFN
jgi:hypothetical protein